MTDGTPTPDEKHDYLVTMKNKEIKLNNSLSIDQDIQALAADFVKVMIDRDTRLCTFIFFKKHPKPALNEKGITLDGIHEQAFLEIKVPFETAFALSLYMNEILKDIRQHPSDHKTIDFGPGTIIQGD